MSIVVTCSCTMTYRLPDRYAGKRCRCRECGSAIRVPTPSEEPRRKKARARQGREGVEEPEAPARKRKKRKPAEGKERKAGTTRRLNSQEQEILGEGRALRRAMPPRRPISESMHQISPLTLSGGLERPDSLGPSVLREARPRKRARGEAAAQVETPTRRKAKPKARRAPEPEARPRKGKPAQRVEKGRAKDKKDKAARARLGAKPAAARGRKAAALSDSDELDLPRTPARNPLHAALIGAGVLCLLIGLAVGLAFGARPGAAAAPGGELGEKLTYVEGLVAHQQWEFAERELEQLIPRLEQAGAAEALAQARSQQGLVKTMTQFAAIQDDESRLATLLDYVGHQDAQVRLGVAMQLKSLSSYPEAQEALARLARDNDAKIAGDARQALVAAGGPHALPFLAEAIEQGAAVGGKLGEMALERALELDDPEVVPVLVKALQARKSAAAGVLVPVLDRLRDLGDPQAVPAAKDLLGHADPAVREAAKRLVDDLS